MTRQTTPTPPTTPRAFERWLRSVGFSREAARRICSKGWPAHEAAQARHNARLGPQSAARREVVP
jgi:hypothetical protein